MHIPGTTANPDEARNTQQARNMLMNLDGRADNLRFLIRDRAGRFPALLDTVLTDAGIQDVLSGIRIPRINAIMERRLQTCRRELPQPATDQTALTHLGVRRRQRLDGITNEHDPHLDLHG